VPERRVEIAPAADQDLEELLVYSASRWGLDKALGYIGHLHQAFERLCTFPNLGASQSSVWPDARSIVVGEHVVYYRVLPDMIRITHVIHRRRDPGRFIDNSSED
jgi:toxin ParE1/3/4